MHLEREGQNKRLQQKYQYIIYYICLILVYVMVKRIVPLKEGTARLNSMNVKYRDARRT